MKPSILIGVDGRDNKVVVDLNMLKQRIPFPSNFFNFFNVIIAINLHLSTKINIIFLDI